MTGKHRQPGLSADPYFKGDIIEYQSLYGIVSEGVMEENSEQINVFLSSSITHFFDKACNLIVHYLVSSVNFKLPLSDKFSAWAMMFPCSSYTTMSWYVPLRLLCFI